MPRLVAVVGDKRNHLTLMARFEGPPPRNPSKGVFACDCGKVSVTYLAFWLRGTTKSCGCHRLKVLDTSTHGQSKSKMYDLYCAMRGRLDGKTYHTYKDVKCDPRWDTFEGFIAYPPAGTYGPGKVLSRLGDRGDYTPENCRWTSKSENAREACETSGRMHVLADGRYAVDVAREHGIDHYTVSHRIRAGWTIEDAATVPKRTRRVR